ncbi:MAG TPA: hypothetical protein VFD37_03520, partial [Solirubrobacterales bacterium]|nr:hypothetical protein [Solirubrobacterales bacterium]
AEREAIAQQPTEHFDVMSDLGEDPAGSAGASENAVGEGAAGDRGEGGASEDAPGAEQEAAPRVPNLEQPPPPPGAQAEAAVQAEPAEGQSPDAAGSGAAGESGAAGSEAGTPPPAPPTEEHPPPPPAESATPTPEPPTPAPESAAEEFDEKSLSDELDEALEEVGPPPRRAVQFDDESDEYRVPQRPRRRVSEPDTGEYGSGAGEVGTGEQAAGRTGDQGTGEHAVDEPGTGEEDVLEETPEFLEETPEHDRLWFEQRPPKDFDFND